MLPVLVAGQKCGINTIGSKPSLNQWVTLRSLYCVNTIVIPWVEFWDVLYCFLELFQGVKPAVVAGIRVQFYCLSSLPYIASLFPCSYFLNFKKLVLFHWILYQVLLLGIVKLRQYVFGGNVTKLQWEVLLFKSSFCFSTYMNYHIF